MSERKRELMKVLIIASALVPLYIIYMIIFDSPLPVSIFTAIYSSMIVIIWALFYIGFFDGKIKSEEKSNGNHITNTQEEIIS